MEDEESTASRQRGADVRVATSEVSIWTRVKRIWACRELLVALTRKELKVKYKNSVLGFAWSLLNPALNLAVFYLVFSIFLKNGIPNFALWLLCGILIWNFISVVLPGSTGSVVANAGLVKKVPFPREVLPLASIGSGLVHFFLQSSVLVVAVVALRQGVAWSFLPLVPLAIVAMVLLAAAVGVFLSAVNVQVRDAQHLLELLLLAWFWLTPIVYPYRQVSDRVAAHGLPQSSLMIINPITPVVTVFQRVFYNRVSVHAGTLPLLPERGVLWYGTFVVGSVIGSFILLAVSLHIFARLEGKFAEEL
jgi:ABC-2 type transport system permease protein